MRAMVFEKYGPPEVLQYKEVDMPEPDDNEVLVKTCASTVSAPDWRVRGANPWIIRFIMGFFRPKHKILGYEFGGIIESTGSNVTRFKNGDQVFGMNAFGMKVNFGTYAEYFCMPQDWLILKKPENITYEEAAVIPSGSLTALHCLRLADIKAGQQVLVYGASGSIGTSVVQLAKYYGAEVTGVCSTANLELVGSLGADKVIDYTVEDFTSSGRTWDFILDTVGKRSFLICRSSLKEDGIYMSTGPGYFIQNMFFVVWTSITGGKRVKLLGEKSTLKDLEFLRDLLQTGKLKPVIDRSYPLEEVAEAHRYVEKGHKKGNVVIAVAGPDSA